MTRSRFVVPKLRRHQRLHLVLVSSSSNRFAPHCLIEPRVANQCPNIDHIVPHLLSFSGLRKQIEALTHDCEKLFAIPELRHHPYNLHAVIVHDGTAVRALTVLCEDSLIISCIERWSLLLVCPPRIWKVVQGERRLRRVGRVVW